MYLLARTCGARDCITGIELSQHLLGRLNSLQIHHVFPKALLYEHGYERSEVNAIPTSPSSPKNRTWPFPTSPPMSIWRKLLSEISICLNPNGYHSVSYTHLRAHETKANLVCRL